MLNYAYRQATTADNVTDPFTSSQQSISDCADIACSLEFIPTECQIKPVLTRSGQHCYGCVEWKPSCKSELESMIAAGVPNGVACPKLECPLSNIPIECKVIETYEFKGLVCNKCPIHNQNCTLESKQTAISKPDAKCPVLACTMEFIPEECRDVPTTIIGGQVCNGCMKWKESCKARADHNAQPASFTPRKSCGLLRCKGHIPSECEEKRNYTDSQGQVCQRCPEWRVGCREEERKVYISLPDGAVPAVCPLMACKETVPADCQEKQPYTFIGRRCYKCPKWREGCQPSQINMETVTSTSKPEIACPSMRCKRIPGLNNNCYQREYFKFMGKVCENCPSIRKECRELARPIPHVSIEGANLDTAQRKCPPLACQMINIHPACREETQYMHEGQACQGCPKQIPNCIPPLDDNLPRPPVPDMTSQTQCPLKACTLMLIPPECRDEQPYSLNGVTCYHCPKWREGCIPGGDSNQMNHNEPEMSCPLFACPRVFIPKECRDEQSFQFRGKSCYRCPKWREGCKPTGNPPNLLQEFKTETTTQTTTTISSEPICPLLNCTTLKAPAKCVVLSTMKMDGITCTGCPTIKPDCPSKNKTKESCPPLPCPRLLIPKECRSEQSYEFKGQTCYLCPRWKPGCIPGTRQTPLQNTNSVEETTRISDLTGVIPVDKFMSTIETLVCPPLPCPDMLIPPQCREETSYRYNGFQCRGCPRWRLGCQPSGGMASGMNANGMLSFSLFNKLFGLGL
ncbi:uncharacterized protein LOC128230684 [Mya arenaria]|uniref:uncharacterized protein LOC128230684 n=1 Tax=Mya arenaria TaxID=6604 RepID=UPI0022E70421|nr:uncharacterized protein LOC128230684 [Mya arenaria]